MSTDPGLHRGGARVATVRALLRERDGDACGRCGELVDWSATGRDPLGPHIGHIIARSHGGTDDMANLRIEHMRCNLGAGDRITPPRARIARPVPVR